MKQEIRQNGEIIIESDDTISIPMIFNNLTGKNFDTEKDYQTYIKSTAIPLMGFRYGKIEFWENDTLKEVEYITILLSKT